MFSLSDEFLVNCLIATFYVFLGWVWVAISRKNAIQKCISEYKNFRVSGKGDAVKGEMNKYKFYVIFRFLVSIVVLIYILYPTGENDAPLLLEIIIGSIIVSVINVLKIVANVSHKSRFYDDEDWNEYYLGLVNSSKFII